MAGMTPPAAPFGEVDEPQTFHQTGDGEMWVQLSKYDALKAAHAAAAAAATAARNDALEEAAGVCEAMKIRNHFASNNFPQAESGFNEGVHEAAKAIRALKAAR